ncbi:MAG: BTAD domain-containing putative transcriptional regulator [Actinomycetota bacterium]
MEFRVLGPLEVVVDGEVVSIPALRQRALIALLIVHVGEVLSTDRIIEELWGDDAPASGANALRFHVSKLRSALGVDSSPIVTHGSGYVLDVDPLSIDAVRFEQALIAALGEMADAPDRAGTLIRDALALWRGVPYSDLGDPVFIDGEVRRLNELRTKVIEMRFAADLARGLHADVVADIEAVLVEYPFRERLWAHLMVALYRSGRQADALHAYQRAATALGEELGIEPSAELRDLEGRILLQDPSLAYSPERRTNLPTRSSSFIGRDTEIALLVNLCGRERMVTITGIGGIGKTRLAIEVARRCLPEFDDGVFMIDLTETADGDGVGRHFLSALGLVERPGQTAIEALIDNLARMRCLLVVDNCEHVVGGVASTVAAVLPACSTVHVVATSRVRVGVEGEELWELSGLQTGLPGGGTDPDALFDAEAVRLFVDRAHRVRRSFAVDSENVAIVAGICQTIDGIPLAIELAAARIRITSLAEIMSRLTDRFGFLVDARRSAPERHRTLVSMIDWSYDLLTESEQRLFRLTSVFRGGFGLAALQAICRDTGVDIAAALESLVDASLITVDTSGPSVRYRLLETVRVYATEHLDANHETDDARDHHLSYFASMGEHANQGMRRGFNKGAATAEQDRFWRTAVGLDVANLQHALEWALDTGDADAALAIVTPLGFYLLMEVKHAEAIEWLDAVLDRDDCPATPLQCESLCRRALCLANIGDLRAEAAVDEAEQAVRRLNYRPGYGFLSTVRSQLAEFRGDIIGSHAHREASLACDEEDGELATRGLYETAERALLVGQIERAITLAERLEVVGGDEPWLSLILRTSIAAYRGNHQEALLLAREALTVSEEPWWEARAWRYTSYALLNLGQLDEALATGEARVRHYRRFGPPDLLEQTFIQLSLVALRSGDTDQGRTRLHEAVASAKRRGDPYLLWIAFHAAAEWSANGGDPDTAVTLLSHNASLTQERHYAQAALKCTPHITLRDLAGRVNPQRFRALVSEGVSVTTDELAAHTLRALAS